MYKNIAKEDYLLFTWIYNIRPVVMEIRKLSHAKSPRTKKNVSPIFPMLIFLRWIPD